MKIFPSILCITFFGLLLISCSKKSGPQQPDPPTKTELITTSAWKLEDAGFDQDKNGTIEISAMGALWSCQIDNTLSFKTNNSGITDEGATKCNPTDPQTTNFNWSFADAEANINVSGSVLAQINGKSKVVTLTTTNLTLARDTTITGLGSGWVVVKLKH